MEYFKKARNIVEFSVRILKIKPFYEFSNQLHLFLIIIVFHNYCFDKLQNSYNRNSFFVIAFGEQLIIQFEKSTTNTIFKCSLHENQNIHSV